MNNKYLQIYFNLGLIQAQRMSDVPCVYENIKYQVDLKLLILKRFKEKHVHTTLNVQRKVNRNVYEDIAG